MLVGLQNSYPVLRREDVRIERGFSSRTRLVVSGTLRQKALNRTHEDRQARKYKTEYNDCIILVAMHREKKKKDVKHVKTVVIIEQFQCDSLNKQSAVPLATACFES